MWLQAFAREITPAINPLEHRAFGDPGHSDPHNEIVGISMARGGINKAVVQKARQSLLAKGMYPSIDAVRVELGNTGSKTTISRYLKEIESFDPRPPSSRERMGEELSAMVGSLLDRLMEEGDESIDQARSAFDLQRVGLEAQIANLQSELTGARRQLDTQQSAIEAQTADLQTTQSSLQAELTRNAGISQRCTDLEALVVDRDKQIQSLEEKHVHARGALEHYRESVKEQRDQDQRRHEAQLHESQVEQRKLRESLAIKCLEDWHFGSALSGTFHVFSAQGAPIITKELSANILDSGISRSGRLAFCTTANSPTEDDHKLALFDLKEGNAHDT